MVKFGAELSLKDSMYANMQKNLKMQKQFSEQVNRTSASVKTLGKAKASPTIKPKDKASQIIDKVKGGLKTVGNTVAKATVAIKDKASAGLSKIGDTLKTLAKGATVAIGIAGAGATALMGGAITEGASLQQSVGGVETLFKGDAGKVKANADLAYKTAGLSANAYMETVTSFSASLLNSLGGDTAKSAEIADMAIIDMADNANKFGTDMESIQNAYQGFAKQNYTMLDNLKLGYGGTKEEMKRLLSDAQKLTGVKYDMDNLSDVYSAIHAIQENLDVTGTTAKEASSTFAGSFASMKASVSNLLGKMATGGNVKRAMSQLIDSASTFLFDNAIPMVSNVISSLPKVIGVGITKMAPKVKEAGSSIAKSLKEGLISILPASMGEAINSLSGMVGDVKNNIVPNIQALAPVAERALSAIGTGVTLAIGVMQTIAPVAEQAFGAIGECVTVAVGVVQAVMPTITTTIQTVVNNVSPIIETFKNIFITAMPVVQGIIEGACTFISGIMPTVSSVFETVGEAVQGVLSVLGEHMGLFSTIVSVVVAVVSTVWSAMAPVISTVVDTILLVVDNLLTGITEVFNFLSPYISVIWDSICGFFSTASETLTTVVGTLQEIFQGLSDTVSTVFGTIQSVVESSIGAVTGVIQGAIDTISGFISSVGSAIESAKNLPSTIGNKIGGIFGFAYGKDRVPYDNYPAILHQGEKVLTRNQADQYDRHMSTRGVNLSNMVEPLDRSAENTNPTGKTVGLAQEEKPVNTGSTTVNIDKLADTVVIEKEADVDKVVEDMISKFRKLVPNMA